MANSIPFVCACRWRVWVALLLALPYALLADGGRVTLQDSASRLQWSQTADGWRLQHVVVRTASGEREVGVASGAYTLLYSESDPDQTPVPFSLPGREEAFPEREYIYNIRKWQEATSPVALNRAGRAFTFFPAHAEEAGAGVWTFTQSLDDADVFARWMHDPSFPGDILVELSVKAKRAGYFSLATPTLAEIPREALEWAVVPGYFQGNDFNPNFVLAMVYGHGLPEWPVLARERATSILASIATNREGLTLAVVPAPGTAADPWPREHGARSAWRLGLSHLNRAGQISPTLYHPVLGEVDSRLEAGEQRTFRFRYVLRASDWFEAVRHTVNDVYHLPDFLVMKQPARSLSDRLRSLHEYVTDDATSLWRTEDYGGKTIGAQAYLGGILGSDKDGMKNSDYGAMWMLARLTGDPRLTEQRLPYARNFKLVQQQQEPGFFQGAAIGQYYLSKSRRFTEEWGDYVEPVALTYYTMLDLGNILLFSPEDEELRERLRLGAERLLAWQSDDGRWEVAYDHQTQRPLFTEVPDLRPTFYGLLVAYRLLGDSRYLDAVRRGADWLIRHAVEPGRFLGVCGDNRFAPDFATAQIAQGFLDLHELTGESRYREAGLATARFYVTAIFAHPLATEASKHAGGQPRRDWEITQFGLGFEHGGAIGSAGGAGPILLASHAGMFVRVYQLTGEELFRDLARAAALARDAFVNPETSVASYYWNAMSRGAGPFPHHAWWQIGWIMDYLVSEIQMRSAGHVWFPAGFITPKVGPHRTYGFARGRVLNQPAELAWGRVDTGHPACDTLLARATDARRMFVIVLNNRAEPTTATIRVAAEELTAGAATAWRGAVWHGGGEAAQRVGLEEPLVLPAFGWGVLALDY